MDWFVNNNNNDDDGYDDKSNKWYIYVCNMMVLLVEAKT